MPKIIDPFKKVQIIKNQVLLILLMLFFSTIYTQYSWPGAGVNWTMDDLGANSSGVIILNEDDDYEILEDLNILTYDTISLYTETMVICHPEVSCTVNGIIFTELELQDEVTFKGQSQKNYYFTGFRFENSNGSFLEKGHFKNVGGIKLVESYVEFLACKFNDFNQG